MSETEIKTMENHELYRNGQSANKGNFRNFIAFWSGQQVSLLGSSIVQFVLIWWITIETQSELMLGIASLVALGPMVLLSPFSGVIADKISRKLILFLSDTLQAVAAGVLIVLFLTGNASLLSIFIIMGVRSALGAFHQPVVMAMTPTMVPKDKLSRINGISYLFGGAIRIIGPILGALFLGLFDIGWILWIDVITLVIALIPLAFITIPTPAKLETSEKLNVFAEFREGIITIKEIKGLLVLLGIFALVNFFISPLSTLMPLFIEKIHNGTEDNYAFVMAFFQAGMIVGALFMSVFKGFKRKVLVSIISITSTLIFAGVLAFIPTGVFWALGVLLFISSLSLPLIDISLITALQLVIPEEKMGRATGVLMTISAGMTPLGMFLSGLIANYVGIKTVFIFSSVICIALVILLYLVSPARNLDKVIIKKLDEVEAIQQEQKVLALKAENESIKSDLEPASAIV